MNRTRLSPHQTANVLSIPALTGLVLIGVGMLLGLWLGSGPL